MAVGVFINKSILFVICTDISLGILCINIFVLINVQLCVAPVSWTVDFHDLCCIITIINIQDMRRMIDVYLLPCPAHIAHTPGIALLMRTFGHEDI